MIESSPLICVKPLVRAPEPHRETRIKAALPRWSMIFVVTRQSSKIFFVPLRKTRRPLAMAARAAAVSPSSKRSTGPRAVRRGPPTFEDMFILFVEHELEGVFRVGGRFREPQIRWAEFAG